MTPAFSIDFPKSNLEFQMPVLSYMWTKTLSVVIYWNFLTIRPQGTLEYQFGLAFLKLFDC